MRLDELATPSSEYEPWSGDGGLSIYYVSDASGDNEIWTARRGSSSAAFGAPTLISELSAPGYDGGTWVDARDELIAFHSGRFGGLTILMASRARIEDPFGEPAVLAGIDGPGEEQDPWLSSDLRTIVFVSDRDGSDGLYTATR